jgi:hypothetical protein
MDSHVRPGLAKSEGAKHKTVAAAFSDIFDNARFHGEAFEGATHVKIILGQQANSFLKVRSRSAKCQKQRARRRAAPGGALRSRFATLDEALTRRQLFG